MEMMNMRKKILMVFAVLVVYLACMFASQCMAKPTQLVDYDAQTFFENYKLACKENPRFFNSALATGELTYQGETGLYKKYLFHVGRNATISVYENKSGYVSTVEVESGFNNEEEKSSYASSTICVEHVLSLDRAERTLLNKTKDEKVNFSDTMNVIEGYGKVYGNINKRWIHLTLKFVSVKAGNDWKKTSLSYFSADDEE